MRRLLLASVLVVAMMAGASAEDITTIWVTQNPLGILVLEDGSVFEVMEETVLVMSEEPVGSVLSSTWMAPVYDDGHAGLGSTDPSGLVEEPVIVEAGTH